MMMIMKIMKKLNGLIIKHDYGGDSLVLLFLLHKGVPACEVRCLILRDHKINLKEWFESFVL